MRKSAGAMDVMIENIWQCVAKLQNVQRTSWQVAYREAVLDTVAGLSVTPTLQAGVFLLRRLQHVVTAQTLKKEKAGGIFHEQKVAWCGVTLMFPCRDMGVRVIYVVCCRYHRFLPEHRHSFAKPLTFSDCCVSFRCFRDLMCSDDRRVVLTVFYHDCVKMLRNTS